MNSQFLRQSHSYRNLAAGFQQQRSPSHERKCLQKQMQQHQQQQQHHMQHHQHHQQQHYLHQLQQYNHNQPHQQQQHNSSHLPQMFLTKLDSRCHSVAIGSSALAASLEQQQEQQQRAYAAGQFVEASAAMPVIKQPLLDNKCSPEDLRTAATTAIAITDVPTTSATTPLLPPLTEDQITVAPSTKLTTTPRGTPLDYPTLQEDVKVAIETPH